MLDNLEVIEGFIRAWKNDNLSLNDVAGNFGINANFIQSKSDDPLFAGEPLSFQNELLNGIQFIQVYYSSVLKVRHGNVSNFFGPRSGHLSSAKKGPSVLSFPQILIGPRSNSKSIFGPFKTSIF